MTPDPKITPKLLVAIVEQARIEAAEEAALRVSPQLVIAVVLAGLIGIGWMVRSTWAQESEQVKPATPVATPPPLPAEPQLIGTPVPNLSESPAISGIPTEPLPAATPPPPTESVPAGQPMVAGENEDPEKTVHAFVAQNRKVAEGQLKSLKSEAERLRARLQKVEAGIKRWESLVAALEQSEAAAKEFGGPLTLEAIPSTRRQFRAKSVASEPERPSSKPAPSAATESSVEFAPAPAPEPAPSAPESPR